MQFVGVTIGNLQPVFKTFMEAYESWNETRGSDPIKKDYMNFIEKWKYYYDILNKGEDVQSLLSCIKEMKLLLVEMIPKFETFQKERLHAFKRVSEAHTSLIHSMKEYVEIIERFLITDEMLKNLMGYEVYTFHRNHMK